MNMDTLKGSIVALVTPFTEEGDIDFEALERLVDFQLEAGTDGILVLGTTGESSTMTDEEDIAVARAVVKQVAGRVPVIGGAGSNSTAESLAKARALQNEGVDGLLLITPYYNKSNEEGIYQHVNYVMDRTELPSILYNIPGRTGCSFSVDNVRRLAEHPRCWGIKEASGNISYAADIATLLGPEFRMVSGNDDIVVPLLSLGGSGVISVWANIMPREVHELCVAWDTGNTQRALELQLQNLTLIHALFAEVNPIPVKAALARMGLIKESYRQPLWPLSHAARQRLDSALEEVGLI